MASLLLLLLNWNWFHYHHFHGHLNHILYNTSWLLPSFLIQNYAPSNFTTHGMWISLWHITVNWTFWLRINYDRLLHSISLIRFVVWLFSHHHQQYRVSVMIIKEKSVCKLFNHHIWYIWLSVHFCLFTSNYY